MFPYKVIYIEIYIPISEKERRLVTLSLISEWRCALKYDILIKLFYQNMKEYSLQNLMQQHEQKISKNSLLVL